MGKDTTIKELLFDFWDASDKDKREEAYTKLHPALAKLLFATLKWKFGSTISNEDMEDLFYKWVEDKIIQPNVDLIETCAHLTEVSLKKYLTKSIINCYIDELRHKRIEDNMIEEDTDHISYNHEDETDIISQRSASELAKSIYKRMSERQKAILFKRFYKEFSVEDICKDLNIEKSTVYNEIKAIMNMIGQEAGTYEEGDAIEEALEELVVKDMPSNRGSLEK